MNNLCGSQDQEPEPEPLRHFTQSRNRSRSLSKLFINCCTIFFLHKILCDIRFLSYNHLPTIYVHATLYLPSFAYTIFILRRSFTYNLFSYNHSLHDIFLMVFCRTIFCDIRSYDNFFPIFRLTIFCLVILESIPHMYIRAV